MNPVIITASDSGYFFLLQGLVGSLAQFYPYMPIIVIDCLSYQPNSKYLSTKQKAWLALYPNVTVRRDKEKPGDKWEKYFRQLTYRDRLPELFPGYDTYLWLDADVWLQTPNALENYFIGARDFDVATVADCDRNTVLTRFGSGTWRLKMLNRFYGEKQAKRLYNLPLLFCGNFSARANSKFWPKFRESMTMALDTYKGNKPEFGVDLLAFCHACYNSKLSVGLLPFSSGYVVGSKLPRVNDFDKLVEPYPPYNEIDVLHIAGEYKWKRFMLQMTYDSGRVERDLIWPKTFDPGNVL